MDREERRRPTTGAEADGSRVLVTLLFTDLVGSTELAAELGDRRWRSLLERHHETVRELLQRFRGREVDCSGDGFFATFETATHAVCCGFSLTRSLWELGLRVRVGLHTGECERLGEKVSGVAVHTAARLSRLARPHEVLVTSTVKDVVSGSGLRFEERGTHVLKGLPGTWQLFAAVGREPDEVRGPVGREPVHAARRPARPARRTPLETGRGVA
jgi:class 3 adenylate cyclase